MSDPTVFHKILAKEIPADFVYEDEHVVGFLDIHPKAPTHVLFVPREFVASVADLTEETSAVMATLALAAKRFADMHGIDGYRLQVNVGKGGGQEVFYLHVHFLSQQSLKRAN